MIALLVVCLKGDPTLTHLSHRQFRSQESMQGITGINIHRNRLGTLACKRRKEETKLQGMDLSLYSVTRRITSGCCTKYDARSLDREKPKTLYR